MDQFLKYKASQGEGVNSPHSKSKMFLGSSNNLSNILDEESVENIEVVDVAKKYDQEANYRSSPSAQVSEGGSLRGQTTSTGEVFNVGDYTIVKEFRTGDENHRKPLYQPRQRKPLRPGLNLGLDKLTNNKLIKDVSDLSSEEILERTRHKSPKEGNIGNVQKFYRNEQGEIYSKSDDETEAELELDDIEDETSGLTSNMADKIDYNRQFQNPKHEAGEGGWGKRFINWLNPEDVKAEVSQAIVPSEGGELSVLLDDDEEELHHRLSSHAIYVRKKKGLKKLERLARKDYRSEKRFTQNSSLREIEDEVEALEEERSLDISIKAQQKMMMGVATAMEIGNKMYNPLDLELDGFSENVYTNIGDYDEIFEELHEKYKEQISIPPELRLLGMFLGSAIMFHFSKTIFADPKSKIPNFENIMAKYPEIRKAYQEAALREMGNSQQTTNPSNYPPPPNLGPMGNIMQMFGGGNSSNPLLGNILNMMMGQGGQQNAPRGGAPPPPPYQNPRMPSGYNPGQNGFTMNMPPQPPPQGYMPNQRPQQPPPPGSAPRHQRPPPSRPPPQRPMRPQQQPIRSQSVSPDNPPTRIPTMQRRTPMQQQSPPPAHRFPNQVNLPNQRSGTNLQGVAQRKQTYFNSAPVQKEEIIGPDDDDDILGDGGISNRMEGLGSDESGDLSGDMIKSFEVTNGRRTKRARRVQQMTGGLDFTGGTTKTIQVSS